jgi:hypothetical protein
LAYLVVPIELVVVTPIELAVAIEAAVAVTMLSVASPIELVGDSSPAPPPHATRKVPQATMHIFFTARFFEFIFQFISKGDEDIILIILIETLI